jgi:hypothetical protein
MRGFVRAPSRAHFRSSRKVAAGVAAALVAGTLTVIFEATPAVAAPAPNCVAEQTTALAAGRTAAACHRRVEILAERTEVSQTFVNGDGSQTLEVGIEPERVRKGSSWVPVDTRLKETDAGLEPRASVLPMVFSAGGDGPFARLRDGKRAIAITWPGRLPKPVIAGDTAVYRNVLPDVDLKVTAEALGFSEVLVVRSRAATRNPKLASLRFGLRTEGVKVAAAPTGGLAARDAKGEAVFTAPAPLMWDSSAQTEPGVPPEESAEAVRPGVRGRAAAPADKGAAPPGSGTPARKAVMKVRTEKDALVLTPDAKLLGDPGAQLPLYIDPSWTGSISSGAWTSVWSKHKGSSFWKNSSALTTGKTYGSAGAGRTEDCTGCSDHIIRSFFRMDVSKVRKKQIVAAEFRIEQKHSWTCSPKSNAKLWLTGGISDKTTWNKQPTWDSKYTAQSAANRKNGAVHGCSGPGTIEFNTTSMVAKAAAGNWSTLTVGLRAGDEGTLKQWKRFNHASPKLAITYNSTPNGLGDRKSDGKTCATGTARPYVLTQTPILAAKHSDPDTDQQNLATHFYWWPLGGSRSETNKLTKSSGNPSATTVTIPSGKLADGGTYVWQARTYDGRLYGAWSGTCEFTVDATPPPTPGDVTSADYPADNQPHGGVGLNGTFEIVAPTVRPHEIKEYAWTLDSGVLTQARNVPARTTDRGATIALPPLHDGVNTLRVWARDQAGRYSQTPRLHTFLVRAGDGPAAEWTFDEESGDAADTTTHGNTAVLNAAAARVPGRGGVGFALSPNGSGSATRTGSVTTAHPDTGAALPVRTDSSVTVTARAKLTATGGTGKPTIVAANGARSSAFTLGYSAEDNRWRFAVSGSDVDNPVLYSVLSNAAPVTGRWVHLAAVHNATAKTISLYVDGVLQTAVATVPATFNATTALTIGKRKWNGGDDGYFNGAIDDVRVYNFVETAAKIAEMAVPLPAAVTFPDGTTVAAGGTLPMTLGGGGDLNVVKFRYSLDTPVLDREATAGTPGGTVNVPVDIGSRVGDRLLYVAAVDSGNRVGRSTQHTFTVESAVALSGAVLDGTTFLPVGGATVTLSPGGRTVQSGDDGSYRLADFAPGPYTVSASKGGKCGLTGSVDLEISGATNWDIWVYPYSDDLGYTCRETTAALSAPSTTLALTGDNAVTQVPLPFEFPFYGQTYTAAWVDTNGVVSFDDPAGSHPAPDVANASVAPFWDDLVVDSSASVRTAVSGTGSDAKFTVQWRNVHLKESASQRLSFEAVLTAGGAVSFTYDALDGDAEKGAGAEVGIKAPEGVDGLPYSVGQPALATGKSVVFNKPEAVSDLEKFGLSGRALNAAGTPMSGVSVTLDPSGRSVTTGADGVWRFTDLVADSYTATASTVGRCPLTAVQQVDLAADTAVDLRLGADYGGLGYACSVGTAAFQAGTQLLPGVTGDDVSVQTAMPFPVTLHGVAYSAGWISTNGLIGFGSVQTGTRLAANPAMPSSVTPNAVVAPFWDDLEVDASAGVYTKLTGTAPNRTFIVEWRNAKFRPSGPDRVTFEVQFAENGQISFHYGTLTTPLQQGAAATVGLESASGTVASQYLFQQAVLTSNSAITYTPAAAGAVEGTVTVAVTGAPAAGIPVTLNPGGRTATTGADGTYQFAGLPVGEYTVAAATGDTRCAGQSAREFVARAAGNAPVDLSVMSEGDEFGYRCTAEPVAWVAGDIVEGWTEDEATWQKNPPFPVKLYGESYTSAWINTNGLVTFKDPMYFGWIGSTPDTLPSDAAEGKPNAAVYAFWDDWIVDSSSRIATKSSGTAPNRQWVVEWRNVRLYNDATLRASFEIIFTENGQISLAYKDLPANPLGRGSEATVGIENASGTIAFQYSSQQAVLASGQGVVYRPSPPGQGSLSGTVSCGGVAVPGTTVTVAGLTATTGSDGRYRVDAIPAGNYAVIATTPGGPCAGSAVAQTIVGTSTQGVADFPLANTPAGAGYTITEQPVAYTPANSAVLPITGDDAYTQVTLPFPVRHYGVQRSTAWVDTNGLLAFTDPGESSPDAWPIPSAKVTEEPNDAVYPFWHDWVVDAQASVRTTTRGTAPSREYVVEWRNVASYEDPGTRMTFQAVLHETGGYSFAYTDNDGTFLERGGGATIGIENPDGTVALQYTYRQPVLRPGNGLRINVPAS